MLGARIAALRRSAGMNQAALAEKLRISPSAVGMYEQGRREPSLQILAKLAEIFGVSIDFLVTGKPMNDPEEKLIQELLLNRVGVVDAKLERRSDRPLSRQELAVLFAAMLMEP